MRRLIFLMLCLTMSTIALADIYQYQDAEGNIVFSDKPVEGAFKRKIGDPTVIKFENLPADVNKSSNDKSSPAEESKQEAKPYTLFKITSPENNGTVIQNEGTVSVSFNIQPQLQTKFGHNLIVALDGQWKDEKFSSASATLHNVDRGTHTITASVIDKSGNKLMTSQVVTFHLKRFSKNF